MSNYNFFNDDDLAKWQLVPELWALLDAARGYSGVPFIITSGRRTADSNSILKGAVADSSHLTGQAADLWVEDDGRLYLMLKGLYKAGCSRIGLYYIADAQDPNHFIPRHIHVDIDSTKPQNCMWSKKEQN